MIERRFEMEYRIPDFDEDDDPNETEKERAARLRREKRNAERELDYLLGIRTRPAPKKQRKTRRQENDLP
jgi:hypothetical protein